MTQLNPVVGSWLLVLILTVRVSEAYCGDRFPLCFKTDGPNLDLYPKL
jgi:hypothetical protein